jgi:hypothetical protein
MALLRRRCGRRARCTGDKTLGRVGFRWFEEQRDSGQLARELQQGCLAAKCREQ